MEEEFSLGQGQIQLDCESSLHLETIEEIMEAAVAFHGNGCIDQAAKIYRSVLECVPDNPQANFNLATIYHAKDDMENAISCYQQVLESDPENFQVLFYLAGAFCDQGQIQPSINTYMKAISINPGHADSHYNLGIIHQYLDEHILAGECYKKVIEIDPDHAGANYNLGIACYENNDYDSAIKYYLKSKELSPEDVDTYYNLAVVYTRIGRLIDAVHCYEQAIELTPADSALHNSLGLLFKKLKDLPRAEECFREAIRLKPEYGVAHTNLAVVLQTKGKFAEAIECYSKAIEFGHQTESADHMLAALTGSTRTAMPGNYVRDLFDSYAEGFDNSLVNDLEYNTPQSLINYFKEVVGENRFFDNVLDLGCGTGLAGMEFRHICERLTGVDVSSGMLGKAKEKGLYDKLCCNDIVDFLDESDTKYDLMIAADVLNYLGVLEVVFKSVKRCLAGQGYFVFSVEELEDKEGCVLQSSGRFAHTRTYVDEICCSCGLVIKGWSTTRVRKDRGVWIKGLLFIVQKP